MTQAEYNALSPSEREEVQRYYDWMVQARLREFPDGGALQAQLLIQAEFWRPRIELDTP